MRTHTHESKTSTPVKQPIRPRLQPALLQRAARIGRPDDAYEREADRAATRVMQGQVAGPLTSLTGTPVQRLCAECGEEHVQRQEQEEDEELQMKPDTGGPSLASAETSAQIASLRGGGHPLPSPTRAFYETRFGTGFGDVRVHTDSRAQSSARALNARAYTTGRDVVFGSGEYAPDSPRGGALLAHELAHVVQQRGARDGAPIQRWSIGAAPAPGLANWRTVPVGAGTDPDHRPRLNAAERIVRGVLSSRNCVNYFRDTCSSGEGAAALANAFNQAQVYFLDADDNTFGSSQNTTRNIAYNRRTFRIGRYFLARILLHEMFHTCDPVLDANDERDAENAIEACRLHTPWITRISARSGAVGARISIGGMGFGTSQGPTDKVQLNGVDCPVVSWAFAGDGSSRVDIVITIPRGATSGNLQVINNRVRSNVIRFTVN